VAHGTDANAPANSIKAYQGHQWLQLAGIGATNGSIDQDLTTVPGTAYVLSFAATGNPYAGQVMQMEVGRGGSTISSLSFDPTGFTEFVAAEATGLQPRWRKPRPQMSKNLDTDCLPGPTTVGSRG
jgi:hypothetical protein